MANINLEDIQPGMILESDVKDRNGRVLLGTGISITAKHLQIFKMWGITEADIRGIRKEEVVARVVSQFDPVLLQGVEDRIRESFRRTDKTHPFIGELVRLLTIRFARRDSEG